MDLFKEQLLGAIKGSLFEVKHGEEIAAAKSLEELNEIALNVHNQATEFFAEVGLSRRGPNLVTLFNVRSLLNLDSAPVLKPQSAIPIIAKNFHQEKTYPSQGFRAQMMKTIE